MLPEGMQPTLQIVLQHWSPCLDTEHWNTEMSSLSIHRLLT